MRHQTPALGRRLRSARGFTVVEMVVSMSIMLAVTAAIFSLMNPAQGMFQTQPEVSDMQQRLRIGADAIYKDLVMAGAGTYSGQGVGTLGNFFATVLPFRRGTVTPDSPQTFATNRISVLYVPSTPSQTTMSLAMANTSSDVRVNAESGCPAADPLCGFKVGMMLVVFDRSGAYDTFRVTGVVNAPAAVQHAGQTFSKAYGVGAYVAEVVAATYWLKTDTVAKSYQLMKYDGYQTDLPIAENVVGLNFEYYGDPQPPETRKALTDPTGPWTSYGPKPPVLGVDNTADTWPAGENCVFSVAAGQTVTRPEMTVLGTDTDALVKLDAAKLTDGPWCPDASSASRVDADLLRVRKIRVMLRVQVGVEALRGTSALFTRAGTSRGGERFVPDQEIKFDVTPRNLNFGR